MNQRELFDPATSMPTSCPVGRCQAIRLPGQTRVITCAHDLESDPRGRRPKDCLNHVDPAAAPFPEGY